MITLMLLAMLLCYIDRVLMSLASIPMQAEFGWTDSQKGMVLSTFFLGYLVMQVMGGILSNRFGGRNVFLLAVLLWSLFTLLTPPAAYLSFSALIVVRFMLGFGEGAAYPAGYNLIHDWMPVRERSRSIGGMSTAASIGTVGTLLVAGAIIEAFGWPSVFYLFGSMGAGWALFWLWKVPATPVPPDDAEGGVALKKPPIPWRLLLTHPAVLTVYVTSICAGAISFTLASWLPSYFADTFGFSVTEAGLYSILPWVFTAMTTVGGGAYADLHIGAGAEPIRIRKRVTVFGFLVVAAGCAAVAAATGPMLAVAAACALFAGLGIAIVGYSPTAAELLPHHGDVFYGFAAAMGSVAAVVFVSLAGFLLERTGSYDALFLLLAVIGVLTAVIYLIFGRAESLQSGNYAAGNVARV